MNAIERSELCLSSMKALHECVCQFEAIGGSAEYFQAGYKTPKNAQANKTAIKRQITSLRQSLLALEAEI